MSLKWRRWSNGECYPQEKHQPPPKELPAPHRDKKWGAARWTNARPGPWSHRRDGTGHRRLPLRSNTISMTRPCCLRTARG